MRSFAPHILKYPVDYLGIGESYHIRIINHDGLFRTAAWIH